MELPFWARNLYFLELLRKKSVKNLFENLIKQKSLILNDCIKWLSLCNYIEHCIFLCEANALHST